MAHPLKGRKQTPEHVAKRASALRGRRRTATQRAHIAETTKLAMGRADVQAKLAQPRPGGSAAKLGAKNPMFGRPVSEETRRKRSDSLRRSGRENEKNPAWRGDEAGSSAVHMWLRRYYPYSGVCEECGETKRTEWSFQRWPAPYTRDRDDYRELCRPCHMAFDFATGERKGHS